MRETTYEARIKLMASYELAVVRTDNGKVIIPGTTLGLDETPGHDCGVFGVYAPGRNVGEICHLGLFALQHRGQESAGIAVSDGHTITVVKDRGLVTQVFGEHKLASLDGHLGIGHVRYTTNGGANYGNCQPIYRGVGDSGFALGHNGNLTNTSMLAHHLGRKRGLNKAGATSTEDITTDQASSDTALIAELVVEEWGDNGRSDGRELANALQKVAMKLEGGFSIVAMDDGHLVAMRDRHGFWPLVLGRLEGGGWVVASESAALDIVGAHYLRDIEPGEIITCGANGLTSEQWAVKDEKLCVFEFVYFSRPDTRLYGQSVHAARQRMGEALAVQLPVEADMVMPIPDSGVPAAQGYARASGIPYGDGLVKNRYVGRTFIQATLAQQGAGVKLKLNALADNIAGKRLVVVDDSVVRGTTTRQVVAMLRAAGAREIHLRLASPPYRWPCSYGMDTGRRSELLANDLTIKQIQDFLNVDSLSYLALDSLIEATGAPERGFCSACLDGCYPVAVDDALEHGAGDDMTGGLERRWGDATVKRKRTKGRKVDGQQ